MYYPYDVNHSGNHLQSTKMKKKKCDQCGLLIHYEKDKAYFQGKVVHAKRCWNRMKQEEKIRNDKRISAEWLDKLFKNKK